MSFEDINQNTMEYMKQMFQEDAEKMKAFKHFLQSVEAGSVDFKTKELIIIALAIKSQCSYCISLHVKKALEAGASKEEIVEAIWLAAMMGGGPVFMYGQEALRAVEEFLK